MIAKTYNKDVTNIDIYGQSGLGITRIYDNGSLVSTEQVYISPGSYVTLELDLTDLMKEYIKILSLKLQLRSSDGSFTYGGVYIAKESSIVSNDDKFIDYMHIDPTYFTVDLTKYINHNNKIYLSLRNPSFNPQAVFYTNYVSDNSLKPRIIIEAIERNSKVENDGVINIDNISANLANGRIGYSTNLIDVEDYTPLKLDLFYDINYYVTTINGINNKLVKGFRTNFNQIMFKSGDYYIYLDGVGNKHILRLSSNNTYYDIYGTGLIFVKNSNNNGGVIKDLYKNEYVFNSYGLLTSIKNLWDENEGSGHKITISYTYHTSPSYKRISSISNNNGMTITFVYETNDILIKLNNTLKAKINFDSSNVLTSIEKDDIVYNYEFLFNYLKKITNTNGDEWDILYNNYYLVNKITKKTVSSTTKLKEYDIKYYPFYTRVVDNFGVNTYYSYNQSDYKLDITSEILAGRQISLVCSNKYDYSKIDFRAKTDCVLEYLDSNNNPIITVSGSGQTTINNTTGTLNIEVGKHYVLTFTYVTSNGYKTYSVTKPKLKIINGNITHEINIETYDDEYRNVSFMFEANSTNIYLIIDRALSAGAITLSNIYLCEALLDKTETFINAITDNVESHTVNNITFYKLDHVNKFIADLTTINEKMTLNDLLENKKNITESNGYIWYNDKKDLLVGISSLSIYLENDNFANLNNIKIGSKKTTAVSDVINFSYQDYSVNNVFLRTYNENKAVNSIINYTDINEQYNTIREVDYLGIYKEYSYDTNYNLTLKQETRNGQSVNTNYIYNTNKNIQKETSYITTNNCDTEYQYDSFRRVSKIINPLNQEIDYLYDDNDNILSVSTTLNNILNKNEVEYDYELISTLKHYNIGYNFEYDVNNLVNKIKIGSTNLIEYTNIINTDSKTKITKYANNYYIKEEYDKYGRLIKISDSNDGNTYTDKIKYLYSNSSEVTDFDPNATMSSKLRKVVVGSQTRAYQYDLFDRISSITAGSSYEASLDNINYDDFNRLSSYKFEIGTDHYFINNINYINNVDNRINYLTNEVHYTYNSTNYTYVYKRQYEYNDNLRRTSKIEDTVGSGHGLRQDITYKTNCHLVNTVTYYSQPTSGVYNNIGSITYSYDKLSNITSISDTTTNFNNQISFEYDGIGRLTRENNQKLNKTILYEYDSCGNIISKKTTTYTTQTPTSYTTINYGYNTTIKDRLISYNGNSITYDSMGNPLTFLGRGHTWTRGRMLSTVNTNNGILVFAYDNEGKRTKKYYTSTNNYHTYIYDDSGNIISESITNDTTTNTLNYIYVNKELIGFTYKGNAYLYKKNIMGDIMAIYNTSGSVVAYYVYDAWGNVTVYGSNGNINTSDTFIGNINPFRFRSYYYDRETKYYYLKTRYYVPEVGRYLNLDRMEYLSLEEINGLNLYAYCLNNPVMYSDGDGNFAVMTSVLIGAIIGFACSYIPDVVTNFKDGFDWSDFNTFNDNWVKYIGATFGGAIGGFGTGIGTTMLFGGVGNIVSEAFSGNLNSFGDVMLQFAFGALTSGIAYGISKGISTKLASSKISKIIGASAKNSKINANLAKNGFGNMKVGKMGMKSIAKELYKQLGYENLQDGIGYILDFGMGFIF